MGGCGAGPTHRVNRIYRCLSFKAKELNGKYNYLLKVTRLVAKLKFKVGWSAYRA